MKWLSVPAAVVALAFAVADANASTPAAQAIFKLKLAENLERSALAFGDRRDFAQARTTIVKSQAELVSAKSILDEGRANGSVGVKPSAVNAALSDLFDANNADEYAARAARDAGNLTTDDPNVEKLQTELARRLDGALKDKADAIAKLTPQPTASGACSSFTATGVPSGQFGHSIVKFDCTAAKPTGSGYQLVITLTLDAGYPLVWAGGLVSNPDCASSGSQSATHSFGCLVQGPVAAGTHQYQMQFDPMSTPGGNQFGPSCNTEATITVAIESFDTAAGKPSAPKTISSKIVTLAC